MTTFALLRGERPQTRKKMTTGDRHKTMAKKYEYLLIEHGYYDDINTRLQTLNEYGARGWRVMEMEGDACYLERETE